MEFRPLKDTTHTDHTRRRGVGCSREPYLVKEIVGMTDYYWVVDDDLRIVVSLPYNKNVRKAVVSYRIDGDKPIWMKLGAAFVSDGTIMPFVVRDLLETLKRCRHQTHIRIHDAVIRVARAYGDCGMRCMPELAIAANSYVCRVYARALMRRMARYTVPVSTANPNNEGRLCELLEK